MRINFDIKEGPVARCIGYKPYSNLELDVVHQGVRSKTTVKINSELKNLCAREVIDAMKQAVSNINNFYSEREVDLSKVFPK